MPGSDFAEALAVVLGEVGAFPFLPELPARGAGAEMTGRSLALVRDIGVDLQPAGWRLTDASGRDHRRAVAMLAGDLDVLEEQAGMYRGPLKLQVAGPWTLAATVERPRGDRVLADHGARRDLAQALAEGVRGHIAEAVRRVPHAEPVLQVDEPALSAVLGGEVPTASGFSRHRAVSAADAAQALDWVLTTAAEAGAGTVVHCCAGRVPLDVLRSTAAGALSLDINLVGTDQYDALAAWVDSGRGLWPGVVPAVDPVGLPPSDADLTRSVVSFFARLGYADWERLPATTVSPTCGLAAASPPWARGALTLTARVAGNLAETADGDGRMEA